MICVSMCNLIDFVYDKVGNIQIDTSRFLMHFTVAPKKYEGILRLIVFALVWNQAIYP